MTQALTRGQTPTPFSSMQAVLFDPGPLPGLEPLMERHAVGTLTVAGKPLVHWWCEQLYALGIRNILLLLSHLPEQVRSAVGSGQRWGLEASYINVRQGKSLAEALMAAAGEIRGDCLIAGLHTIPLRDLAQWMEKARRHDESWILGDNARNRISVGLLQRFDPSNMSSLLARPTLVEQEAPGWREISTIKALWQANMDVLDGRIEDANPIGFESEPGIFICRGSKTERGAELKAPCVIGETSWIGAGCVIGPRAVIGKDVIIDEQCRVEESVILDRSLICAQMDIARSVVAGHLIYKVDEDIAVHVEDPLLLGKTKTDTASAVSLRQRCIALLLYMLLYPFIMLAALRLRMSGRKPWVMEDIDMPLGRGLDGSIQWTTLRVRKLNTTHPLWAKVPWLVHTIRGELALIGARPRRRDDPIPEWAKDLPPLPTGIITLADVTGASLKDDDEEAWIADCYAQVHSGVMDQAKLLLRWISGLLRSGGSA